MRKRGTEESVQGLLAAAGRKVSDDEVLQASELMWGATHQAVAPVASQRGWPPPPTMTSPTRSAAWMRNGVRNVRFLANPE